MGMVNTTVTLKPKDEWRPGLTEAQLQREMDEALQFPGFPNVWTQPIRNRLDMLLTGIKTPVGIKVFGADLAVIQGIGEDIERILQDVPGTRSVYAGARQPGVLHRHSHRPGGDCPPWGHDRDGAGCDPIGPRRSERHADDRGA